MAMSPVGWIVALILFFFAGILLGVMFAKRKSLLARRNQLAEAQVQFHGMREQLEAKFLQRAGLSGRPRGLRWADCEFESDVTYARDRQTGQLSAFVAVSIKFEAVPGGGMEEVEAVQQRKYGTAVFRYDPKQRWMPEAQPMFNLNPLEAVQRLHDTLEPVGQK
jgi:hypothetical protein